MSAAVASDGLAAAQAAIPEDRPRIAVSGIFNKEDADFILRCPRICGRKGSFTDYRVHKAKLALSPVFADMLNCGAKASVEQLPIVVLPEKCVVIEMLLRFMYGDTAALVALEEFQEDMFGEGEEFYEACFKYDVPFALMAAEITFSQYLDEFDLWKLLKLFRLASRNDRHVFRDKCLAQIASDWELRGGKRVPGQIDLLTPRELLKVMDAREALLQTRLEDLQNKVDSSTGK